MIANFARRSASAPNDPPLDHRRRLRRDFRHIAGRQRGFEREPTDTGERIILLDAAGVDRLTAMPGPGESYSDVILRLAEIEAGQLKPSSSPDGA